MAYDIKSIEINEIGEKYVFFRAVSNVNKISTVSNYQSVFIKDPNLLRIDVPAANGGTMYCTYTNTNGNSITTILPNGAYTDLYVKANTNVIIWSSQWNNVTMWSQTPVNNGGVTYNISKINFEKPNVSIILYYTLYSGNGTYDVWFRQQGVDNLNIYKYE